MLCYNIFDTDVDVSGSRLVNVKRLVKRKEQFFVSCIFPTIKAFCITTAFNVSYKNKNAFQ